MTCHNCGGYTEDDPIPVQKARVGPGYACNCGLVVEASPSQLITADDCERAHYYRYVRRIQKKDRRESPTLASGTAVHAAVEQWLWGQEGGVPDTQTLQTYALASLKDSFKAREDALAQAKKFAPGVCRAVARLPEWLWEGQWFVEQEVSGTFEADDITLELTGRTDLFRLLDEPVPTLELVDVKTTAHDPLEYFLWSPQLRMYAACLKQMYPERLIVWRYVCVPTGLKDQPNFPMPIVFTKQAIALTEAEMLDYARKVRDSQARPRYSRRCSWCRFKELCTARVTGADEEGVMQELYESRDEEVVEEQLDKPD